MAPYATPLTSLDTHAADARANPAGGKPPSGHGASPMQGHGPVWSLDGIAPRIAPGVFIAPTAAVIGDVEIAEGASIWFHTVLRGDTNLIRIGPRSNIQDNSVLHVNPGDGNACLIGAGVTVGHNAIVHAAEVQDDAFVAMGAIVLDNAVIECGGVLAAGAVLTPGKIIRRNELWAGTPARLVRVLAAEERLRFTLSTPGYVQNAIRFRRGLSAVEWT